MSELDDLEEIARQTSIRANTLKRRVHGGHGLLYHPQENIAHASLRVARPQKAKTNPTAFSESAPEVEMPLRTVLIGLDVTSYTELIGAVKGQVAALGLRYQDFDDLAGFPAGLAGKVFGGAQVKRLGPEKMFDAIRAAGLRIRLEPDPQQLEKMKQRIAENYNPRQAKQARMNNSASRISGHLKARVYGYFLKEARKKRWAKTTKKQRSEHARMMAMAGVRKRREQKKRARQRKATHRARNAKSDTAAPIHSRP